MLDVLDELHGLGLISEMPGNRYRIKPTPKPKTAKRYGVITGVLQMTTRGFGFVDAADGESDVFIPPTGVGPALHGDRVEVAARPSPKGREGDVVAVLQRRPARFTGTLMKVNRQLLIEPDDGVVAVGSGSGPALSAARALLEHTGLSAAEIVRAALHLAADVDIYTNHEILCEEL